MLEGIQKERAVVAKNLLKMKMDMSAIQEATGLSKKDIENLKIC